MIRSMSVCFQQFCRMCRLSWPNPSQDYRANANRDQQRHPPDRRFSNIPGYAQRNACTSTPNAGGTYRESSRRRLPRDEDHTMTTTATANATIAPPSHTTLKTHSVAAVRTLAVTPPLTTLRVRDSETSLPVGRARGATMWLPLWLQNV